MSGKILNKYMGTSQDYIHNSTQKEYIRDKWVEFIVESNYFDNDEGVGVITFPAEEMQDLHLFKKKGLIDWEENETGSYTITKGKVVCFEKSTKIFMSLRLKLVNAEVESTEIGSYLRQCYNKIVEGKNTKVFPVDAVNLDYDGNLSKSKVSIDEKIDLIFKFQAIHKKSFCLFITWPSTESEDENSFKELLKNTIINNLSDPSATEFKNKFESEIGEITDLNYDKLSLIGLTKIVLKKASNNFYKLEKHELYLYGEQDRRKMYSVLYSFSYEPEKSENLIYSEDVSKSLSEIKTIKQN